MFPVPPDPRGSHPHDREILWGGAVLLILPIEGCNAYHTHDPEFLTPNVSGLILMGSILLTAIILDRAICRLRKLEAEGGPTALPRWATVVDHAMAVAMTEVLLLPLAVLVLLPAIAVDSPPIPPAGEWLARCGLWCGLFLIGYLAARRAGLTAVVLVGAVLFVQLGLVDLFTPAEPLLETMTWLAEPVLMMLGGAGFALWQKRRGASAAHTSPEPVQ